MVLPNVPIATAQVQTVCSANLHRSVARAEGRCSRTFVLDSERTNDVFSYISDLSARVADLERQKKQAEERGFSPLTPMQSLAHHGLPDGKRTHSMSEGPDIRDENGLPSRAFAPSLPVAPYADMGFAEGMKHPATTKLTHDEEQVLEA